MCTHNWKHKISYSDVFFATDRFITNDTKNLGEFVIFWGRFYFDKYKKLSRKLTVINGGKPPIPINSILIVQQK